MFAKTIRQISTTRALAAILASTPFFFAATLFAQADPPALVARIGHIQGDSVSFMASGSTEWAAGVDNYPMTSGDRIYCDQGSRAEIGAGSTNVRLWEHTDVTLTNLTDQYEQIGLAFGFIRVRIYAINPGSTVEVDTPNGSAVITQPGDYRFDTFDAEGGSDVVVNSGALQITGPGGLNQEVTAGQAVQLAGTNPIQINPVNLPPFDPLDQWSIERDHEILNSQSAMYVSRETPGYSDLDSAGTWSPTPDYGPVWYPTSMPYGWRPYSQGRWVYVAPWGYTWIDQAPWGYAPFHYGRWAVIEGRWGWVPGPRAVAPVYSPALVAFVGGGPGFSLGVGFGAGVAAWFPLGVGEPFVPWYPASPAYARQVNITNVNITNIHNTTIVNNYNTYITNTRTVNNVSQLNTSSVQYANRAQVTAVPAAAMSTGRPVAQAAVKLTPAMQQQLAAAPIHAAPTAPPPTQPSLAPRANVKAPTAAPTLVTPRGLTIATPSANPARLAPVNLPRPTPAALLLKPVQGAVAGRPATAQPAAAQPNAKAPAPAPRPMPPPAEKAPIPAQRPETPSTARPMEKSAPEETAPERSAPPRPTPESKSPTEAMLGEARPEQSSKPEMTETRPAPAAVDQYSQAAMQNTHPTTAKLVATPKSKPKKSSPPKQHQDKTK